MSRSGIERELRSELLFRVLEFTRLAHKIWLYSAAEKDLSSAMCPRIDTPALTATHKFTMTCNSCWYAPQTTEQADPSAKHSRTQRTQRTTAWLSPFTQPHFYETATTLKPHQHLRRIPSIPAPPQTPQYSKSSTTAVRLRVILTLETHPRSSPTKFTTFSLSSSLSDENCTP